MFFTFQHQLSRGNITAYQITTGHSYKCIVGLNPENVASYTPPGFLSAEASTEDFKISSFTRCKFNILNVFNKKLFFNSFSYFFQNLRKHCDIKEVMQAYEIMRQVARNIDQVKRKLEQQTRVKELSGILDGWLGPGTVANIFITKKKKPKNNFKFKNSFFYRTHRFGRITFGGHFNGKQ